MSLAWRLQRCWPHMIVRLLVRLMLLVADAMIADRAVKLDQLKNATAEQKKAILEQMQAQQKDLLEAQKALGRQIRDELRKLQQSQPTGR